MSTYAWLEDYLQALRAHGAIGVEAVALGRARLLPLDHEIWGVAAQLAAARGLRWSGVWAEQADDTLIVNAALAQGGETLLLRTRVPIATPVLASHAPHYPGADRMERHVQDLHGLAFLDHPDARRWIRHRAWKESEFPLRKEFPAAGRVQGETPPDNCYAFHEARGAGVYEIPVGPVHAGIIEPGHFRFQAVGEFILNLEQHLGYVHKGIEKIAEGRDAYGLA